MTGLLNCNGRNEFGITGNTYATHRLTEAQKLQSGLMNTERKLNILSKHNNKVISADKILDMLVILNYNKG